MARFRYVDLRKIVRILENDLADKSKDHAIAGYSARASFSTGRLERSY